MTAGAPLILESNFRPHEAAELGALAEAHRYDVLTYLFTADLRLVYDRYLAREGTAERHWVHKSIQGESFDAFALGHVPFGKIELGRTIRVDAADFNAIDYDGLLQTAEGFAAE
jgi:hypothetical protein